MTITDGQDSCCTQWNMTVFPPHFTWWLGQFSELQLRNSAAHREGLWMINWSPFSMCPYRVTCLFPHCQAWSWWQSSCSCSRLSLGPSRHALPCLPLSCHSTSDVPTILMWLKGHCSPEWDPVWTLESWQSKHVCLPAPVNINVPLDCLLFVGQTWALHRGAKASTQTSCMAWEVIQLWPSSKNRFCNVLLLKPKPGRNYL